MGEDLMSEEFLQKICAFFPTDGASCRRSSRRSYEINGENGARIFWKIMGLLFIDMNWLLQGVPTTRHWTKPNYTESSIRFAEETDSKHKIYASFYLLVVALFSLCPPSPPRLHSLNNL